jgi:serine phosphatase RsbU (regulator of sigma subunit)
VRPDKAPIGGGTPVDFSFTSHKLHLYSGDVFYLFSDGYADQFGGPAGKKMMTGKFKDFLLTLSDLPMQDQSNAVKEYFIRWKGDHQQVDDVLVMGVRV